MTDVLVALDGRRFQDRPLGGVGRGIACVLPHLHERCTVTVLTDASRPAPDPVPGAAVDVVPLRRPPRSPEVAWLHGSARRWANQHPHVFHGTFNAIPYQRRGPSVVTIHDLTFELHAEDFAGARRRLVQQVFRANARHAAAHADVVVTVSQFSADLIAEHYRVPADRLVVVPNAADPTFHPDAAATAPAVARRLGISQPYVVAVGGAPRRGAEVAVDAWQQLRRDGLAVDLVVLGPVDRPPQPGLHVVRGLDDASWAALLAGAEALCYPSRHEGFGLPGLEATASGTPVVASPTSSLPEVLGDAAAWCDGTTVDAVAPVLRRVLTDTALAADLRRRGLDHAAAWPTWADIAGRLADVYRRVA